MIELKSIKKLYIMKLTTRNIAFISLFTAVICVLSPISFPIGPIPITLATLAIYITGALLDFKRSVLCVLLFILIGLVGVPVFSGYQGGPAKLVGPTGGFIFGYILGIVVQSLLTTWKKDKIWIYPLAMILGTIFIYGFGLVWYMIYTKTSFVSAFSTCVVTFLPGDAIKIVIATLVSFKLRKPLDKCLHIEATNK